MDTRILIVDSRAAGRQRLLEALAPHALDVRAVASMKAASAAIGVQAPDVAFVSGRVDRRGGRTCLERIKATSPATEVVVIRPASAPTAPDLLAAGASDVVGEPVRESDLLLLLDRANTRRRATARGPEPGAAQDHSQAQIESERFIAVNQVLDNISLFIDRISAEVEGGVKYFDQMPYFVSVHNRDQTVVTANAAYRKLLGSNVGHTSWEIYRAPWATPEDCPVGLTLRSEQVQEVRAVVRYRSGLRVPVIVHTAPIYNNDGEVELVLEVAAGTRDVRRLRKELQSTQQRFQQLFDAVPCFIAVLNRDLRITALNDRFKGEFGDVIGRSFFSVFDPSRQDGDPISRTLSDAQPHEAEMILAPEDGRRFNTLVWTSPILTRAGKLLQILVMFIDITQIRKLRENLSSLGLMIGSIAHGIKGILTGLNAGLYLIQSGHAKRQAAKIEEGIDVTRLMIGRIEQVVSDILYYAKKRTLNWQSVPVLDFAADVADIFGERLKSEPIRFRTDFAADAGTFEIDATLLRSAVINILENAADACREDSSGRDHLIEFVIRDDDGWLKFDVRDNGTGMDVEARKKIFDLFYSSKGHRGTGLGMFITDKIVRQHGGQIQVESAPGEGSRFTVLLPKKLPDVVKRYRTEQLIDFDFAESGD